MNRLPQHLRANAVAYLALFVALSGTGYAAINLPRASVGAAQIKNHAIDPVKFNPKLINGNVRAWAEVTAGGRLIAGRGKPRVTVRRGPQSAGSYLVQWQVKASANCVAIAGVVALSSGAGFADAGLGGSGSRRQVFIATYNTQGQQVPEPFYAAVIC